MQPSRSKGGGAGPEVGVRGLKIDWLSISLVFFPPPKWLCLMRSIFLNALKMDLNYT